MNGIIIMGSARSHGHTKKLIDHIIRQSDFDFLDLKTISFTGYDYDHQNIDDDFLSVIEKITSQYDLIIFATPVYWYSMSGIMKNFFDRITDCLTVSKDAGRKLRGKAMASVSCSYGDDMPKHFLEPFKASAEYLGMSYLGHLHGWLENNEINATNESRIKKFVTDLSAH